MCERSDEAQQTFSNHLWRQPIGVHLERVFRVCPVRVDKGPPIVFLELADQQAFDQRPDLRLTEVQEVASYIEGKPVHLIGPAEPACFLLLFHHAIEMVSQVIGRAEPRQASPDDKDHGVLSAAGSRRSALFACLDMSIRLSQNATTIARTIVVPMRPSAVKKDTNIESTPMPPTSSATT